MNPIGTSLSDGRFIYRAANGNIYVEVKKQIPEPETRKSKKSKSKSAVKEEAASKTTAFHTNFCLLFGGECAAFAVEELHGVLALLQKSDDKLYLIIYAFDGMELGAMLTKGERVQVHPRANTLRWVDHSKFIAVSDYYTGTVLYAWNGTSLQLCTHIAAKGLENKGARLPFSALQYLGTLDHENKKISLLDTAKETVASVISYRDTPSRVICSTASHKNFIVIANKDGTFHVVYVTKGSVRRVGVTLREEKAPAKWKDSNALPAAGSRSDPRVICYAISTSQLLVSIDQQEAWTQPFPAASPDEMDDGLIYPPSAPASVNTEGQQPPPITIGHYKYVKAAEKLKPAGTAVVKLTTAFVAKQLRMQGYQENITNASYQYHLVAIGGPDRALVRVITRSGVEYFLTVPFAIQEIIPPKPTEVEKEDYLPTPRFYLIESKGYLKTIFLVLSIGSIAKGFSWFRKWRK